MFSKLQKLTRNISKEQKYTFIKRQLETNPEFDKIFPKLAKRKPNTYLSLEKKEFEFIRSLL